MITMRTKAVLFCAAAVWLGACSDNNEDNNDENNNRVDVGVDAGTDVDIDPDMDGTDTGNDTGNDNEKTYVVTIENVSEVKAIFEAGIANMADGAAAAGPIGPGQFYEFSFNAPPPGGPYPGGARLSLATMFIPSNDYFYAPTDGGVRLYQDDGTRVSGDITSSFALWDAGTEEDEPIGAGANQPGPGSTPNMGDADDDTNVRRVAEDTPGLPDIEDVLEVTLTPDPNDLTRFTVRVTNRSDDDTITTDPPRSVPLSPLAWAVHASSIALFTEGSPLIAGSGLEALAEDGNPTDLGNFATQNRGLIVPLSPGAWAVHTDAVQLFESGAEDPDLGLEAIAEDGDPSTLAASLDGRAVIKSAGIFNTPESAADPGPIGPGQSYMFEISAEAGDRFSFATMFIQSNDWFYAFSDPAGLILPPADANVTGSVALWDAGTEVNERPGLGLNQAPRQGGTPNTGEDEDGTIIPVTDALADVTDEFIRVTIAPKP